MSLMEIAKEKVLHKVSTIELMKDKRNSPKNVAIVAMADLPLRTLFKECEHHPILLIEALYCKMIKAHLVHLYQNRTV